MPGGRRLRSATFRLTCVLVVVLTGCRRDDAGRSAATRLASSLTADAPACGGSDAHAKHAASGIACSACHACAGTLTFGSVTFPRGAGTANGVITPAGAATTCAVGCHNPLGAANQPVAWNAGPLRCTACHSNVLPADPQAIVSSHAVDPSTTECTSCHDLSHHMEGQVRLLGGDGTGASVTCIECHGGQGRTLAGATPPLLVGWDDLAKGDFHGDRVGTCKFDRLDASGQVVGTVGGLACPTGQPAPPAALRITSRWWYQSGSSGASTWSCDLETVDASGDVIGVPLLGQPCPAGATLDSSCGDPRYPARCHPTTLVTRGFGGALLPPYARPQPALACDACHDFHFSTNAFLLAARVNGVALPPGAIDRAGVGGQALCAACHVGDRHQICKGCHKEVWTTDGEYWWFEGNPVDPAPDGSACFYCHGHEGLLRMMVASPQYPGSGHPFGLAGQSRDQAACSHCHSPWAPPPTEYVAPRFTASGEPAVTGVTATSATVSWQTTEPATSYVEYGVGTAGYVAGGNPLASSHAVTLTGLAPGTTYVWRVRTSDWFRNVTQTALQTFTTLSADAVPAPDLAAVSVPGIRVGTYTATVTLAWFAVTAPTGSAVQYEVQLASDPSFTYLVNGSLAGPGVPGSTVGDSGWVNGSSMNAGGKPALGYPVTLTNIPQDDCGAIVPNVYYWRVRARDAAGNVSQWSQPGTFGVFAGDPWC